MELLMNCTVPFDTQRSLVRQSCSDIYRSVIGRADRMRIATGYITADSIIELMRAIGENKRPYTELLIGMSYFEKFTHTQYDAVMALNNMLRNEDLGCVYLSDKTRFHGKMYSFSKNNTCISSIVGSSNLGSFIGTSNDLFETDCLFYDNEAELIDSAISHLMAEIASPLFALPAITDFISEPNILDGHLGVEKVSPSEYSNLCQKQTGIRFPLALKAEAKSNLNCFFGKGRLNSQTGFIQPRPWYEVEMIISKKVTCSENYPKNSVFEVYTDDMYKFRCTTNGTYSKNFRSADDLKILGKWIKGRMESENALTIGQPVTEEVLNKFGHHNILLCQTTEPHKWLLSLD